jgi:Xaa-Pro aminopeptidase
MFDFSARRQRLLKLVAEQNAAAVLVTDEINVRYLSGFSGDSSYLLLTDDRQFIISDSRYDTQIAHECPDLQLVTRTAAQEMKTLVGQTIRELGRQPIAIESDAISKAGFDAIAAEVPGVSFVDTTGLVLSLRAIKDAAEIEIIRGSIRIAEAAFRQLCGELQSEWSELQAAYRLEEIIRSLGGQGRAFDTIVAGDQRAALPHAGATQHKLGTAATVLFDWGAKFRNYCSDLTRVVVTGKPSANLEKIHRVAVAAQEKAIAAIRPGASLKAVDAIARDFIDSSGFGPYFGHGLGHGFGLQIHESPRLSPLAKDELKVGMVVTVEPGIYLPNDCGVRIEDDVFVTEEGCEVLSNLPRSLQDNRIDFG